MVVTCSNCKGRFRIADERVPAAGVRARCSRCSTILFVRHGHEAVAQPPPGPPPSPPSSRPPAPPPIPGGVPDPWGGASDLDAGGGRQPSAGPAVGDPPLPPPLPHQGAAAGNTPGPRGAPGPGPGVHSPGPRALQEDPFGPGLGVHSPGPRALQEDPFGAAFADIPSGPPPPPPDGLEEEVGSLEFDPFNPPPPPGLEGEDPGSAHGAAGEPSASFDPFSDSGEDPFAAVSAGPNDDPPLEPQGAFSSSSDLGGALARDESAGPPPGPQPPPAAPVPEAPFPQHSTVRRAPSREPHRQRVRPLAKVAGESRFSVILWGLVVAALVALGVLVGLGRDPLGIWALVGFGEVGEAIQLHGKDLSAGLYPGADGEQLLYVRGIVYRNHREQHGDAIRVEAKLFDADGGKVGESAGWAGVTPQPEELASVRDEASWVLLSRRLADRLPHKESKELPFVLPFPQVDPGTRRLRIEVVAKAVPTSPPFKEPAPAVGANE